MFGEAKRRRQLAARDGDGSDGPCRVKFASEADSSYVTGEVLTILGGETTAG